MKKAILITSKLSLVLVFLVVLAGSVVRMTGSGMGCPDWPKCFGYFIPPTDEAQLIWKPNHAYQKGQMILGDDEFLVARTNFTSDQEFIRDHWRVYDKHDYAIFNPAHTWIEYINRLLGALSGIPVLLLFVLAAVNVRRDGVAFVLSAAALFSLGFAAWLGKLVVDGNLIPHSITYHMFSAIVLILLLVALVYRHQAHPVHHVGHTRKAGWLAFAVVLLSLLQVYLGTNVREQVDAIGDTVPRGQWIADLNVVFLIHRSFSIIVVLVNAGFIWLLLQTGIKVRLARVLAVMIVGLVLAGVLLNYAGFPASMQPVHLLLAIIITAIQFYLGLQFWWKPRPESVAAIR